ncbi:hypothetical protein P8935_06685 [Telmatobacter sp. DSM 110680]|uniref:Peptidoglycan-binding protein, CsiV n=1 Tax=Telmatobacter sp. DSM 110680 TaxID=3036704 RepID=A0AAU7DNU4_9BACT
MRKLALICCLVFLTMSLGQRSFAQESTPAPEPTKAPQAPAHFYHLDFVVQELGADGKPTNSRSYTATVSTDSHDHGTSIRTGSKIPIATGSSSSSSVQALVNTQWQYVDVGVNIDVRNTRELGRQLSLDLIADVTSVGATNDSALHQPVIRQNKWQASVLIPVSKATVVFTSDSLDNKGSMQVVATATPLQ